MKYRPDIDGLRALAILLVVGYHAFPQVAYAGFIGVDVFFVVSGYLITTIILDDLRKGTFSFRRFYARRIRRLFPALMIVMAATFAIGWYVLYPDEFERLGKHLAAGTLYVPNLIYWKEVGYFDTASETKPLLHLWSLGIEEQFYAAWPIALVMLFPVRGATAAAITAAVVLSFWAQSHALVAYSEASAFYLPMYRAWELLMGAGLAWVGGPGLDRRAGSTLYSALPSLIGVILIVTALIVIEPRAGFAGWLALLPTVGTLLIIASPHAWLNRQVLNHRLLVYIGLISYPLYLWHWPLLSFAQILGVTSWLARLTVVALSVCLAALTYEIIEKRVKKQEGPTAVFGLVSSSVALLCVGLIAASGSILPRNHSNRVQMIVDARRDWEYPGGLEPIEIDGVKVARKSGANEVVLFFGDSHMQQYAPRIAALIERDPANMKTAIFAAWGGCPPIPNVPIPKEPGVLCTEEERQAIIDYTQSPDVDSVVIGAYWNHYLADSDEPYDAFAELESFLAAIARQKRVFLVIDIPFGKEFDPATPSPLSRLWATYNDPIVFAEYPPHQARLRSAMIEMAHRTNVTVIDPIERLCTDGKCRTALDDGTPIYKDASHLRASYVREHADFIDVTIQR